MTEQQRQALQKLADRGAFTFEDVRRATGKPLEIEVDTWEEGLLITTVQRIAQQYSPGDSGHDIKISTTPNFDKVAQMIHNKSIPLNN